MDPSHILSIKSLEVGLWWKHFVPKTLSKPVFLWSSACRLPSLKTNRATKVACPPKDQCLHSLFEKYQCNLWESLLTLLSFRLRIAMFCISSTLESNNFTEALLSPACHLPVQGFNISQFLVGKKFQKRSACGAILPHCHPFVPFPVQGIDKNYWASFFG